MEENRSNRQEEVFSKRVRAGKKRTYFIDVKATRGDDYYITITESKKDFKNPNYYIKQKIFLYKEDFNKFQAALNEAISYVKTDLLPDFQFDMFDKEDEQSFGEHDATEDTFKNLEISSDLAQDTDDLDEFLRAKE
jgi:hypothetical protein